MKFLIGAGGTGGHLYPAIATVHALKKRLPSAEFIFTGRSDKIEGRVIPENGWRFIPSPISGGKSIKSMSALIRSALGLKRIIKREKIDAVICTGAYISIPPGLAGIWSSVPLFLLESNVNPGKAVKFLSRKADTIFSTFTETAGYFKNATAKKIICAGNPIREDIINMPNKEKAREKYNIKDDKPILLVFGGSLGAKSINRTMEKNIEIFAEKANIIWQTGKNYSIRKKIPDNVIALEYIDDMAAAYSCADLAVARSGATTVTELCITGKPAILIPFKHSANNEQLHNAIFLQNSAGARIIDNDDVEEILPKKIIEMIDNKELLKDIADKTKMLGKPDAAEKIAEIIINKIEN